MLFEIRREVKIEPMSRLDYNILRGWTLPADENGADKGVKVTDISSGHVSWLPIDEFNSMNKTKLDDVKKEVNVSKSLHNTCANGATKNVKDIVFWGDRDTFKLISKASSESEGWMKSTKAMQCGTSVVVQVTTQQRNPNGSYAIAEALTTVENAYIFEEKEKNVVIARQILKRD